MIILFIFPPKQADDHQTLDDLPKANNDIIVLYKILFYSVNSQLITFTIIALLRPKSAALHILEPYSSPLHNFPLKI